MAGLPPAPQSASELQSVVIAERSCDGLLMLRNELDELVIVPLDAAAGVVTIGRGESNGISLAWDAEVSRTHAVVERVGEDWTIVDDGLSTNGTFVGSDRIVGRRRLLSGDVVRIGQTLIQLRLPLPQSLQSTSVSSLDGGLAVQLSPAQRRVVAALCRPILGGRPTPATNQEIASELFLSVDAVKTHMQALFQKFGLTDVPQGEKRARVADQAIKAGLSGPE